MKNLFVTFLITASLCGCSSFYVAPTEPRPADSKLEAEVFAARGFLGGTDYEQYKLASGVMWRECGAVLSKVARAKETAKEGESVFRPDNSLQPQERRVEELNLDELTLLTNRAFELSKAAKQSSQKLPAPGSLFSLAQPGLVEIAVTIDGKKERFISSVDAVAEGNTAVTKALNEFYGTLRSVGKPICNANSFYGIRRK